MHRALLVLACAPLAAGCITRSVVGDVGADGGPDTGSLDFGTFEGFDGFVFFDTGFGTSSDTSFDSGISCDILSGVAFGMSVDAAAAGRLWTGTATLTGLDPVRLAMDSGEVLEVRLDGRYRAPSLALDRRVLVRAVIDAEGHGELILRSEASELLYAAWVSGPSVDIDQGRVAYGASGCELLVDGCGGRAPLAMLVAVPNFGTVSVSPGDDITITSATDTFFLGNGPSVDVASEPNPPCTQRPQAERSGYYAVDRR